jgi:hypothetical protein
MIFLPQTQNRFMSKDQYKNPWKRKSSKLIYQNPWIKLEEDQVIRPNGSEGDLWKSSFQK